MATAVTVIALPSLWLMSRSGESGAPNVATAGVPLDAAETGTDVIVVDPPATDADTPEVTATTPAEFADVMGAGTGAFVPTTELAGNGGTVQIAVPPGPDETSSTGSATYRSDLPDPAWCFVREAPFGSSVLVTNRNNNRSVRCRASVSPIGEIDDIVLHTDLFLQLADPSDAPVPVEIDW